MIGSCINCRLAPTSGQSYLSICHLVACMFLQSRFPGLCGLLLPMHQISILKMVLQLFGSYFFAFPDKNFSYTGFEARKIILL